MLVDESCWLGTLPPLCALLHRADGQAGSHERYAPLLSWASRNFANASFYAVSCPTSFATASHVSSIAHDTMRSADFRRNEQKESSGPS